MLPALFRYEFCRGGSGISLVDFLLNHPGRPFKARYSGTLAVLPIERHPALLASLAEVRIFRDFVSLLIPALSLSFTAADADRMTSDERDGLVALKETDKPVDDLAQSCLHPCPYPLPVFPGWLRETSRVVTA
jgi:hypothetical protein